MEAQRFSLKPVYLQAEKRRLQQLQERMQSVGYDHDYENPANLLSNSEEIKANSEDNDTELTKELHEIKEDTLERVLAGEKILLELIRKGLTSLKLRRPQKVPVLTPTTRTETDPLLTPPFYRELPFEQPANNNSPKSIITDVPSLTRQQTISHRAGKTTTVNGPLDLKRSSFQGPRSPRQIDEDQQSAARYVATTKNAVVVELRNTDLILTS